jgi:hypothetical protein
MEMQQMMEFLLNELRANKDFLAKLDANQAKAEAKLDTYQERQKSATRNCWPDWRITDRPTEENGRK